MNSERKAILIPAALGLATFVALHVFLQLTWTSLFAWQRVEQAWWLNSGKSIAVTLLWACVVSAAVLSRRKERLAVRAASIAAGLDVGMIICLFAIGPGNLWPIVVVLGSVLLGGAVLAGALLAWILRTLGPIGRA